MSAGRFDGKVAIITGASQGQGAAESRLFHRDGASVVLTDVKAAEGRGLAAELGARATFVEHDVSDEGGWKDVVDHALASFGRIDVLVNNAATYWQRSLLDETAESLARMFGVNLAGPIVGMRAVAGPMAETGGGAIVNVSSIAGWQGLPMHTAYGSAKWGLRGATKIAALELAQFGIRVNCVLPGAVDTAMRPVTASSSASSKSTFVASPRQMAQVVAFLASDDASAITGADVVADGGSVAGPPAPNPLPRSGSIR